MSLFIIFFSPQKVSNITGFYFSYQSHVLSETVVKPKK